MRTEFSTQRECDPKKWASNAGKLNGKTEDVKILNSYLDAIRHRVYSIHRDLIDCGIPVSGELIKDKYLGVVDKPRMLLEIFEHHNVQFAELVGTEFSIRTHQKFVTTKSHLYDFLIWKYGAGIG